MKAEELSNILLVVIEKKKPDFDLFTSYISN